MKKLCCFGLAILFLSALNAKGVDPTTLSNDVKNAIVAFQKTDPGMKKLFHDAAGYVIFPKVTKGGFILGGAYADGQVFENGQLIGQASLAQGTVGAQVGGQVFSEVIFFETKDTLKQFKESRLEMSGQASYAVAAEGASKNARYVDGVLVFTKPITGLMLEASVGGQKFTFTPIAPAK